MYAKKYSSFRVKFKSTSHMAINFCMVLFENNGKIMGWFERIMG